MFNRMTVTTYVCLLILYIHYIVSCEGESMLRRYWYTKELTLADKICPVGQVDFHIVARSDISCVRKCSGTPGCTGVVYLHSNMTCYGIKGDNPFDAVTSPLPGAVFYKISAVPMTESVADSHFTASGSYMNDEHHMPWHARLNSDSHWSPLLPKNNKQWIQVDFIHHIAATAVITKGDSREDFNYWVESYRILTSADCTTTLATITDTQGDDMIFQGNTDRDTAVQNNLVPHVICRCFRINPVTWRGKWPELRFEVMGYFY